MDDLFPQVEKIWNLKEFSNLGFYYDFSNLCEVQLNLHSASMLFKILTHGISVATKCSQSREKSNMAPIMLQRTFYTCARTRKITCIAQNYKLMHPKCEIENELTAQ